MREHGVILVFCLLLASIAAAQESPTITVRVFDVSTGKPARQRLLYFDRIDATTNRQSPNELLRLRTDDDGKVSFPITRLHFDVHSDLDGNLTTTPTISRKRLTKFLDLEVTYAQGGAQCSTGLFSLDDVLATGVVGDNRCDKKVDPAKFKIHPGEVLFFVGKYHWWERGQT